MKIALLNDSHFGARGDSEVFDNYIHKFMEEIFFPYLKEHNITTLIHLGDILDRRKFINFKTARNFRKKFMMKLWEEKIDTHIILGNHDTYYRSTNEVNGPEELCTTPDGKHEPWIYTKTTEVEFDGMKALFIPWINPENETETFDLVNSTKAEIAFGHLDINGFEMHAGMIEAHGHDKSLFSKFEKVMSGHFHKKSDDGRIFYLGSQYEMTWSDYNDPKHFHIWDTDTRELTAIRNPYTIYDKLFYNDRETNYDEYDITPHIDKHLKLIVVNKTNPEMLDRLLDRFYKVNMHELKIIEDYSDLDAGNVSDDIIERSEDTITLVDNYVEALPIDLDKDRLKTIIRESYVEASDSDRNFKAEV